MLTDIWAKLKKQEMVRYPETSNSGKPVPLLVLKGEGRK